MAQYIVTGGTPLKGDLWVSGNKNSILPLMAATLLASGTTILRNVPAIRDVEVMSEILTLLGAKINPSGTSLKIDTSVVSKYQISPRLATRLRASIVLLGPLLARFGQVRLGFPGGDTIGKRGVGTHFDALSILGAKFDNSPLHINGRLDSPAKSPIRIFLDEASVTATENTLLLAASQPHPTIIENAACEPHVVDLGHMLTKMGAKITGLGSNMITVTGRKNLRPTEFSVGPDYLDAATFAMAAAATRGSVTIAPVHQPDLQMTLLYLSRLGVKYSWPKANTLQILPSRLIGPQEKFGVKYHFQTRPWPGFPTDLMSPLITLCTQVKGSTLLHDWMFESRMFFVDRLNLMGANITICDPHRIIVSGPTPLYGRHLPSPDIRAGMSLLIAALAARGRSEIDHVEIIERGYQDPVERLCKLGAKIERVATRHEI